MRNPEIRWIVEVGVKEVPEEANPAPDRMDQPYPFVSKYVDENSYLLDDPDIMLTLFRSVVDKREEHIRLHGLPGEIKLLVARPDVANGVYLLAFNGERFRAWLLTYYGVITAVRLDEAGMGTSYGLRALRWLDEWTGSVDIVKIRLRESLYSWGPEFSVYIKGLDNQHHYLVTTLNNLYKYLLAGSARRILDDTLNALLDYTKFHFRSEEVLFDKYGYPKAEGHRKQHQTFVEKASDFMEKYKAGEARLTLEVLHFLADWVKNHILTSDHDYGEWFYEHGVPIVEEKLVRRSREVRAKLGLDKL